MAINCQLLIFLASFYFPEAYNRSDPSVRIVEYLRKKITLKSNITNRTGTRTFFGFVTLARYFLGKINTFCLGVFLLPCLVSELQKPSSSGLEPRSFFGVAITKQTTLVLALFFYRDLFPNYRKYSHHESKPGRYFVNLVFVSIISPLIQITLVLAPFLSLNFLATELS
jgi:hypothetical protein